MAVARDIPSSPPKPRRLTLTRQIVEFLACLALLVTICRGFLVEGYMIETGSMAPSLIGYHKRAVCPACGYPFAVDNVAGSSSATCPNCGTSDISIERLLRNEGDQLLVDRFAFDLHRPQRWDVLVFRNPAKPTQAYVKRLVALPGEEVRIKDGDIYIAGKIQAKSLAKQRGMRIPVYDHDYQPPAEDKHWRPRWIPDPASKRWQVRGNTFFFDGLSDRKSKVEGAAKTEWVRYRHWVRQSPGQATSVPLEKLPTGVSLPAPPQDFLKFDSAKKLLICHGAFPESYRDRLLAQETNPEFEQAINDLYEASHIGPITDIYGYNRASASDVPHEVRDLSVSLMVHVEQGTGQFEVALADGRNEVSCVFDLAEKQVRLLDVATGKVVQSGQMPRRVFEDYVQVEVSLMDRQAAVAVDGLPLFEPWSAPDPATSTAGPDETARGSTPWRPVRFGARDMNVEVKQLKLYRDVYYTPGTGRRGADTAYTLKPGEYFVLGDNSPVSRDSRSWAEGDLLRENMFIGRPFVVHLPSVRKRVLVGQWKTEIRIPDFARMRYIP